VLDVDQDHLGLVKVERFVEAAHTHIPLITRVRVLSLEQVDVALERHRNRVLLSREEVA